MVAVAVIGVDSPLGLAIANRLRAIPSTTVVGIGSGPQATLDAHTVDLATTDIKPLLDNVDVVMHCATLIDAMPEDALLDRMTIETLDNVLAASSGVRRFVHCSSATVYGAWSNNAIPLTEDAIVRPNPGALAAVRSAEMERRLLEWSAEHPQCAVSILRLAPMCGTDGSDLFAQLIAGFPPITMQHVNDAIQVVHVDDVAAACALLLEHNVNGVFNVACDGWLTRDAARALLPNRHQVRLPDEIIERSLRALWNSGGGDLPAEAMPYLQQPWAVDTSKLRALGWTPQWTNEATIQATLAAAPYALPAPAKRALLAAGAAGMGAVLLGGLWLSRRRSRRR
jgi:nucleoside-diphosphate-sugar epimerase